MADQQIVTPFGTAKFPRLNTPDCKYDEAGVYKVDLALEAGKETDIFVERLETLFKEAASEEFGTKLKKHDSWPVRAEEDEDGNETGRTVVRCKVKAVIMVKGKEPWDRKPRLMDSKKNPMSATIGGGSVIRCALSLYLWEKDKKIGVTLQPLAVQVKELVEWNPEGQAEEMFDAVEDGFESEDAAFETSATDADF